MPKLKQSKPPYIQIFEHIQGRILRGDLSPGDRIPSLRDIAQQWGVSPVTAGKAVALLQAEGHVTVPGKGLATVVRDPRTLNRNGYDRAKSVRRTGRIYTPGEYAKITSADIVQAPADVAAVLGLSGDSPAAIKRVRVTYGPDHQPVSASISWYDAALAEASPKLLVPERIIEGSWGYVEQQTGQRATRGRDRITTRLATEEDAQLLGIELPAAVKVSTTLLWTDDEVVIEYGVSIAGPGRESTYDYDLADDED